MVPLVDKGELELLTAFDHEKNPKVGVSFWGQFTAGSSRTDTVEDVQLR